MSVIFVLTTQKTQPRPQVFSVCINLHFRRHRFIERKILPNLVIGSWLWRIMGVLLGNQNRGYI